MENVMTQAHLITITKALAEPTRCRMRQPWRRWRALWRARETLLDQPGCLRLMPESPGGAGVIAMRRQGPFHDKHRFRDPLDAYRHDLEAIVEGGMSIA
jgi:hypothetical protein